MSLLSTCFSATHVAQLETESALLVPKSRAALSRYGHHLVVGNELHTRKHKVVFVERERGTEMTVGADADARATPRKGRANAQLKGVQTPPVQAGDLPEVYSETWFEIDEKDAEAEIEQVIIQELLERHTRWIESA